MSKDTELPTKYIVAAEVEVIAERLELIVEKLDLDAEQIELLAKQLDLDAKQLKIKRYVIEQEIPKIASVQQVELEKALFSYLRHIFSEDQFAELLAWYERRVAAGKLHKRIWLELLGQILELLWAGIQISFDNLRLPKSGINKVEK